ncbi:hypothetical protein ES703_49862 [subsurface metagenome]
MCIFLSKCLVKTEQIVNHYFRKCFLLTLLLKRNIDSIKIIHS